VCIGNIGSFCRTRSEDRFNDIFLYAEYIFRILGSLPAIPIHAHNYSVGAQIASGGQGSKSDIVRPFLASAQRDLKPLVWRSILEQGAPLPSSHAP
jgi:hypothetical protein